MVNMSYKLLFPILMAGLLVGCNSEPDPDDQMLESMNTYYQSLADDRWIFTGVANQVDGDDKNLTVTFQLIDPWDEEYKNLAQWQKRSDAMHYCLRHSQRQSMNLRDWNLTVITRGQKAGEFAEIVCGG